jgi:hypothetical protein
MQNYLKLTLVFDEILFFIRQVSALLRRSLIKVVRLQHPIVLKNSLLIERYHLAECLFFNCVLNCSVDSSNLALPYVATLRLDLLLLLLVLTHFAIRLKSCSVVVNNNDHSTSKIQRLPLSRTIMMSDGWTSAIRI